MSPPTIWNCYLNDLRFLIDFPGCLLVVSHDRYFMDKIVDHLFVFKGNSEIEISLETTLIIRCMKTVGSKKKKQKQTQNQLKAPKEGNAQL